MAITVKSDFWGDSYAFIKSKSSLREVIAQLLNVKSMRSDRALLSTLLGASAGSTATATLKRISHSQTELGGVRPVETETLVNRATTAADDTELTAALLTFNSQANAYPVDKATRF